MTASTKSTLPWYLKELLTTLYLLGLTQCLYYACRAAYEIRLYAINEYGRVVHEFDPYFNYRATEYMWEHGWKKFREWFDYMSWYPLGRPVGTTIYPGMQVTSCFIKKFILPDWSINDICVFVPPWFGVLATLSTSLLAYECSVGIMGATAGTQPAVGGGVGQPFGSILGVIPIVNILYAKLVLPVVNFLVNGLQKVTGSTWGLRPTLPNSFRSTALSTPALECGLFTAAIMCIVPAHLLRSVGGGYDNESVATFAMTLTFYCWVRSLRGNTTELITCLWGVLTGIAYFYMVAAWGGYVFCLNLIGVHASVLVLLGRYSTKLHRAYTTFYVVGTFLAIQVPVVGWTPLKSLEQIGPFVAFGGMQLIEACEIVRRRRNLSRMEAWKLRVAVFGGAAVLAAAIVALLAPTGYFGPVSARVRGLFVEHTKTGNPLVDSVAEHQAASPSAYYQYLNVVCNLAPVGFGLVALLYFHDGSSFLLVYGLAAYYFSHRMVRLILLTAPIASALGGIALGHLWAWMLGALVNDDHGYFPSLRQVLGLEEVEMAATATATTSKQAKKKDTKTSGKKPSDPANAKESLPAKTGGAWNLWCRSRLVVVFLIRVVIAGWLIRWAYPRARTFRDVSHDLAKAISHPTIISKAHTHSGEEVLIDDYREAYWWLRDNTPEDARIMAWWDYGYQITGIANRTTLADGNTWNHEHIALLGRTLTASEKEGHRIARHLADYVLVWAGGGGDDLAKSPHLRRIANSVYRHICPGDPTCRSFGMRRDGSPTREMEESLLYKLVANGLRPGVDVDKNRFREVFSSRYGKVRIYKIQSVSQPSKDWVLNNRICDVEGGWFCRGQYPPALKKILEQKKDFKQLEDFNVQGHDSEYHRQYMENLNNPKAQREKQKKRLDGKDSKRISKERIEQINEKWENNDKTTMMWELISSGDVAELREVLLDNPELAHIRSEDGRGPMWWAHEYGRYDVIELLRKLGVTESRFDIEGVTPLELSKKKRE